MPPFRSISELRHRIRSFCTTYRSDLDQRKYRCGTSRTNSWFAALAANSVTMGMLLTSKVNSYLQQQPHLLNLTHIKATVWIHSRAIRRVWEGCDVGKPYFYFWG